MLPQIAKYITAWVIAVFCFFNSFGQVPQFLFTGGGTNPDIATTVKVAPNGNIVVAGKFSGTVDLDPSAATHNVTSSSGSQDIFLACYSSSKTFLWGFAIGGNQSDGPEGLTVDAFNNVYMTGWFRDVIDFDPGAGTASYTCQGIIGAGVDWGGDGFLVKYSSVGAFQWVVPIQSTYGNMLEGVAADAAGNVYVAGDYKDAIDFDPGPGTKVLNSNVDGSGFLAKYYGNGQLGWAFGFGKSGIAATNNTGRELAVDDSANVYIAGFFQGTNNDFDPGVGTTVLSASGLYDGILAKYDSSGNYMFALSIQSSGVDYIEGIALDSLSNVYVTGYSIANSIDCDLSSAAGSHSLSGAGGENVFIAKYSRNGQYQWSRFLGGTGQDIGWDISVGKDKLYVTGEFAGTVNFNPSGPAANLISAGGSDVFLSRFDLNGNYECAFNIGGTSTDRVRGVENDISGNIWLAGGFSGSNIDFDPGSATTSATSNGSTDFFVVQYNWVSSGALAKGVLIGDTICSGAQAYLTFVDTTGGTTSTIMYTDGSTTTTKTVQSNVPFAITPSPTTNTTYTLYVVSGLCGAASPTGSTVNVLVTPAPVADAGNDTIICPNTLITLNGAGSTGVGTYAWTPTDSMDNSSSTTPKVTVTASTKYRLVVSNVAGCSDTDWVSVTLHPNAFNLLPKEATICKGEKVQLFASGGYAFDWSNKESLSDGSVFNPTATPDTTTTYVVSITEGKCNYTGKLPVTVTVKPTPEMKVTLANAIDCRNKYATLQASGADSYSWRPSKWLNDSYISNPIATPAENTRYIVTGTNSFGCTDTAGIYVDISKLNNTIAEPNAFTPNADGRNDCYKIMIPFAINTYEFSIYNRWGNRVFHTKDPNECWDGSYNGKVQDLGTYYYYYKLNAPVCGDVLGEGSIHLVR